MSTDCARPREHRIQSTLCGIYNTDVSQYVSNPAVCSIHDLPDMETHKSLRMLLIANNSLTAEGICIWPNPGFGTI